MIHNRSLLILTISLIKKYFKFGLKGRIIVCEYSLIHETKKVLKYLKKTKIYLIIIKPCLSTQNPIKI